MHILGIDVSKAKLHCSLLDPATEKFKSKTVSNDAEGFAGLLAWLARHGDHPDTVQAVLEATGVYHEAAALALHEAGLRVAVVNPAQARDFARGLAIRTKTDGVDAKLLARYGAAVRLTPWQPPSPEVRALRALMARREAVAADLQRERNRLEKAEVVGETGPVMDSITSTLAFLHAELQRLERAIDDHIDRHPGLKAELKLLTTIPAVGPAVGRTLLSVMASRRFGSAEQLAAYLGLVPIERQSGQSVRGRARLSKAGPPRVRAVLYMAAVVAIRHNPHVKALYARLLARGKSKMSALGAAMRKLVHLCFGVLKTRQPYNPLWTAQT